MRRIPVLLWIILMAFSTIFFAMIFPIVPVYARDVLEVSEVKFGWMWGALAIGQTAGAFAIAARGGFRRKFYGVTAGATVFGLGLAGFGLSDTREEYWPHLGVFSHVQFVNDFADAMCIDKFHLSGNSMGATNTAHYVVEHPDRVLSYILIATYLQGELGVDPDGSKRNSLGGLQLEPWNGTAQGMRDLMSKIIMKKLRLKKKYLL